MKGGRTGSVIGDTDILKHVWISSRVAEDHGTSHHKQCPHSRHVCVLLLKRIVKRGPKETWECGKMEKCGYE